METETVYDSRIPFLANAFRDFVDAALQWRLWLALAREDIIDQHRYTVLGPLWLMVNYILFVGTFMLIFGTGNHGPTFIAYMAIGLLVWLFLSEAIAQAPGLFFKESGFIKGTALPLPVYAYRMAAQLLFRTSYAAAVCIVMTLYVGVEVTWYWLIAAAGFVLMVATLPAAIIAFAVLGVMLPDFRFIIGHLTRLGMFLTPIFWPPFHTGIRGLLYAWNPFTYYLDVVRTPMMSAEVPVHSFLVIGIFAVLLWMAALLLLGRFRKRVVFWL